MAKSFEFVINFGGEVRAGLRPFSDVITVIVDSDDPGGDPGEFESFMIESLREWYDGASVSTEEEYKRFLERELTLYR